MSRKYALLVFLSAVLSGCFASMPPKVSDDYLGQIGNEDSARLETIEKEIIAITNEKESVEKERKVVDIRISIAQKEIKQLEGDRELIIERQKLFVAMNDQEKIKAAQADMAANENLKKSKTLELDVLNAKKKDLEKLSTLKDAELSAKVAEQYHEQAKIARANQDKMLGAPASDKDTKDRIDVSKYEKYLESQKKNLEKAQKDREETAARLKEAMDKQTGSKS